VPIISPSSGGGGGVTPLTSKIRLAATAVGKSSGAQVLFDTVVFDGAGYFDAANHQLLVPANRAGKHLFTLNFLTANVGAASTPISAFLTWSGAEANAGLWVPRNATSLDAGGQVVSIVNANVGDAMTAVLTWPGGGTIDYSGGVTGTYMTVTYLGTG
jgi:hypothetical protein